MKEVSPGIFLIKEKGTIGAIKPPENIYIIGGEDALIYDGGYGGRSTIKHVMEEINKIKRIYLKRDIHFQLTRVLPSHVHPDHFSGLKALRKYLDVKIFLTKEMAEVINSRKKYYEFYESDEYFKQNYIKKNTINMLKFQLRKPLMHLFYQFIYGLSFIDTPDKIIENEIKIQIDGEKWNIFPSPGHSSDHISLYNEKKGILFSGDNILRTITTWLGPPNSDIQQYIQSIKKIKDLPNLNIIFPAHGSPITNPHERIQEILEHRKHRTNQVYELIKKYSSHGISPEEIINILYPNGRMMNNIARGWIVLTLRMLVKQGLVEYKINQNMVKFYPK
ncbi:MAG: MBL fold metallo-hydrolase [Promethearchaeota archaeon]|nr:MAG: MBL fold metallo-hydrolase [Candidatus Lokiarchaeota archaeon]